jgi:xanthine dehydrogenase small subunit
MTTQAISKPVRFFKGAQVHTLGPIAPTRTLLEVLREDLHCTGTKEGCGEGDCGACTVVVGELRDGALHTRAVNSCIKLAHSVDGMALWTVEDLAGPDGALHPAQAAMLTCHGSQCGFCTPGFVMSLVALSEQAPPQSINRETASQALSGNLCRCTGYRPILDAAKAMASLPRQPLDSAEVRHGLRALAQVAQAEAAALAALGANTADEAKVARPVVGQRNPKAWMGAYAAPTELASLLALRQAYPKAQLVAGCTDVGLWITKQHRDFAQVLDLSRVQELRQIDHYAHHIAIGAAVNLTDAFAALVAQRPQLQSFAQRFAGLPVRNAATLGGNVANGSPIGDSMPLLIALGANLVLVSSKGYREMPLEDFYWAYRKTALREDEVLGWIKVPKPLPVHQDRDQAKAITGELCQVYKISKRWEDDISAVCLALNLHIEGTRVVSASLGAGGVAATPVRARATQAALTGQPWTAATVRQAMAVLRAEFTPISDMRASSSYRSEVLGNLLWRFWLESQGTPYTDLQGLSAHALEGSQP